MTHKVQKLIKARDAAYRSWTGSLTVEPVTALRRGIKSAKAEHKRRIEAHFNKSTNPRQVWGDIRAITGYKKTTYPSADIDAALAEGLKPVLCPFRQEQ